MLRTGTLMALGTGLLLASAPAMAQDMRADAAVVEETIFLQPGQSVWYEDALAATDARAPVAVVVSIPAQQAYVYRERRLVGVSTVSTGKPGKDTPVGEFTILQKKTFHRSNLYSAAPMPFMQRLTWDGIALHAGHLPGYPASHGCIRLPAAFAKRLYTLTALGGTVAIIDDYLSDPRFSPWSAPALVADTDGLGGSSFDVVTIAADLDEQGLPLATPPADAPARQARDRGGTTK